MDFYCSMELPAEVLVSLDKASEELLEELRLWGKSKEEITKHIEESCLSGLIFIASQGDILLLFMDKTPYTIVMHILAPPGTNKNKIVRHVNATLDTFKEKTDIHKLEVFSTCPDMHWVLSKCGFVQEGLLVDSRRIPTGEFIDEYCYGYLIDV